MFKATLVQLLSLYGILASSPKWIQKERLGRHTGADEGALSFFCLCAGVCGLLCFLVVHRFSFFFPPVLFLVKVISQ